MILDYQQLYTNAWTITTGTQVLGVIQVGAAGSGTGAVRVPIDLLVTETFAGGTNSTFYVQHAMNEGFTSSVTMVVTTAVHATAALVNGFQLIRGSFEVPAGYLRVSAFTSGTHTTGTVSVKIGNQTAQLGA